MGDWSIGSFSEAVLALVEDVPTSISGAQLDAMVERKIEYAEEYTGATIGTTVEGKYQSPILNLTIAEVTSLMALQGADVSNLKLGEFSVGKGGGGNLDAVSKRFEATAIRELNALGTRFGYKKVYG